MEQGTWSVQHRIAVGWKTGPFKLKHWSALATKGDQADEPGLHSLPVPTAKMQCLCSCFKHNDAASSLAQMQGGGPEDAEHLTVCQELI